MFYFVAHAYVCGLMSDNILNQNLEERKINTASKFSIFYEIESGRYTERERQSVLLDWPIKSYVKS